MSVLSMMLIYSVYIFTHIARMAPYQYYKCLFSPVPVTSYDHGIREEPPGPAISD